MSSLKNGNQAAKPARAHGSQGTFRRAEPGQPECSQRLPDPRTPLPPSLLGCLPLFLRLPDRSLPGLDRKRSERASNLSSESVQTIFTGCSNALIYPLSPLHPSPSPPCPPSPSSSPCLSTSPPSCLPPSYLRIFLTLYFPACAELPSSRAPWTFLLAPQLPIRPRRRAPRRPTSATSRGRGAPLPTILNDMTCYCTILLLLCCY